MTQRPLIAGAIGLLVLIWGSTWAVIRLGLEGIPPFAGVALRFTLAAAILFVLGRILRVPVQRGARLHGIWTVQTVFSFCISYGVVYWAEQWVPSGLASIVFATMPLWVALFAHWRLPNEPLRMAQTLGVVAGFLGVVVIFSDDLTLAARSEVLVPALVLFASPIAAAIAHVYVKKWGSGVHPMNVITVPMLLTGVVMAGLSLVVESDRSFAFDLQAVGALLYLAILGSVVTFTMYYWVLERIAATRLSLITLAIPVVAVLVGTLLLDEPFSTRTGVGAALVLVGVGLASR
ncbi:MAG: EamA family transporter [bacterium]|nr:EamA family transporter [bacterium]